MFEAFLTNTSIEGLRPLGTAPQRSFELITGTVRSELDPDLGPAASALFAEPVATQFGDRFDWYAAVEGKAQPLTALDETARAAVEARLATLIDAVRELAAQYSASDLAENQRLGEALGNALSYPGPEAVFVVAPTDGPPQPILVNWAWVSDKQATVQGSLRAPDARPVPKPMPIRAVPTVGDAGAAGTMARSAPPRGVPMWLFWLGWLLLALLLAAILWLMVPACGVRAPFPVSFCPAAVETEEAPRRTTVLQDQIAILERQIGIADRACQPDPMRGASIPPLPALTPDQPQALPDIDARRSEAGAALGDLTFTLAWDGPDDLDLSVTCPAGLTVSHLRRNVCNGQLDVDSNVGAPVPEPVENIFFTDPQGGSYEVRVRLYSSRSGGGETPFQLQIRSGDRVENLSGIVSGQNRGWSQPYNFGGQ